MQFFLLWHLFSVSVSVFTMSSSKSNSLVDNKKQKKGITHCHINWDSKIREVFSYSILSLNYIPSQEYLLPQNIIKTLLIFCSI